jgi:hypothetical protein
MLEASQENSLLRTGLLRSNIREKPGQTMSEQRMTTIEDGMHNLKEMIRKQDEEIERMNNIRRWLLKH